MTCCMLYISAGLVFLGSVIMLVGKFRQISAMGKQDQQGVKEATKIIVFGAAVFFGASAIMVFFWGR